MKDDKALRARRTDALRNLVELRVPLNEAIAALASFGWDSDEDLVTFTRAAALRVVRRYEQQELVADDLRRWAEALEGRDDLAFEAGFEDRLKDFLFEIATPQLAEVSPLDLATQWAATLDVTSGNR